MIDADGPRPDPRRPSPAEPDEGKRRRRKGPAETEAPRMDMTPMIDCVFQLLIFFMVAARFKTLEGKLLAYLPKKVGVHDTKPETEPLPVCITLDWNTATRQCRVYVGQTLVGLAEQDGLTRAEARVRQLKASGCETAEIAAEPAVPYRHVVGVLNGCIRARVKEIRFAAVRG